METQAETVLADQLTKNSRSYVDSAGNLLSTTDQFVLRVLPQDLLSVLRAVSFDELNTQVALKNTPSQIIVDGMSAGKRSIERAMRRVQIRFQDFAMLIKAVNEIYAYLQRITRIQSPAQNSIVARHNFHLMIDGSLIGMMPQALSKLTENNLTRGSVVRVVGPLVNYGRKLFWNPVGTSSKMKYRRVKSSRGIGVRFMPLRGASKLSPQFRPYAPRTLRKLANKTSNPTQTLRDLFSGSAPPGRAENAGQILKRNISKNPAFRGLHFTDGWVEYAPAVGWSKLGNARVPAFGVMFARKGRVLGG
jgi:hypothetical protein